MYEHMYREPPSEVARIQTERTYVEIPFDESTVYYVTVMPCDAHGESVGRRLYPMSDEIKLDVDTLGK